MMMIIMIMMIMVVGMIWYDGLSFYVIFFVS
jgi:hypothetical protein